MLNQFGGLLRNFEKRSVHIDGVVCKLHYRVTASMLLVFSITLSAKQFVGDPINCIPTLGVSDKYLNDYCWIAATFTLNETHPSAGRSIIPGVRPEQRNDIPYTLNYYQWVGLVWLLQAGCFYIPRYLWKSYEGNFMGIVSKDMDSPIVEAGVRRKRAEQVAGCFMRGRHTRYVITYLVCEALNLANVLVQIYFVDYFLGGELNRHSWSVLSRQWFPSTEPATMTTIFPLQAKCQFRKYGPSGGFTEGDTLCVLPLNQVNGKIFVFLWLWFYLLAGLTFCNQILRSALFGKLFRYIWLRSRAPISRSLLVKKLCYELTLGDWFVLYRLTYNVDNEFLEDLMYSLEIKLDGGLATLKSSGQNWMTRASSTEFMKRDAQFKGRNINMSRF